MGKIKDNAIKVEGCFCVQCGENIEYTLELKKSDVHLCFCNNSSCPNYGLLQVDPRMLEEIK